MVGARTPRRRVPRADRQVRGGESRHHRRTGERTVCLDEGAALRRSSIRHHARRRRPRRRLGERLRLSGRHRRPERTHGGLRLRRQRAGEPDPGRRQHIHDPGRELRLSDVHERHPARRSRRHRTADHSHRVRGCRGEGLRPRRRRFGLGASAVARGAERRAERCHVVGMGIRRLDAERRPAGPDQRRRRLGGRLHRRALGRRRRSRPVPSP